MELKTYIARDMQAALAAMRFELGEDAIIVASERTKDGGVLVRAAVEEPLHVPSEAPAGDSSVVPFSSFEARYRRRLMAKLRSEPDYEATAAPSVPFDRETLLDALRAHRLPEQLSTELIESAERSAIDDMALALASALDKRMRTDPVDADVSGSLMIVGSFGVGKTGVAARLAAAAKSAGREVWLVATDVEGAGQLARLETLAAHLDVPVLPAPTIETFEQIVARARQQDVLIIADSAGFDPRGPVALDVPGSEDMEKIAVVSAACDAEEAAETARLLKSHGVARVIVTGLDLVRRKGALVAFATSGLALAQVSASPYLADGLEPLSPLALARKLLAPMDAPRAKH
jgi:flagellar biosynthesis protein FlhF